MSSKDIFLTKRVPVKTMKRVDQEKAHGFTPRALAAQPLFQLLSNQFLR